MGRVVLSGVLFRRHVADFLQDGHYRQRPRQHVRGNVRRLHIPLRLLLFDGVSIREFTRARRAFSFDTAQLYSRWVKGASRALWFRAESAMAGSAHLPLPTPGMGRDRPRECAGGRCGLRMVSARRIQAVSFRIPHRIWHVRKSGAFSRPASTEMGEFPRRKSASAPLSRKHGHKSTEITYPT